MLSGITLDEGEKILLLVAIIGHIIFILLNLFGKRILKKFSNIITAVIFVVVLAFTVYIYIITENFSSLDGLLMLLGGYLLIKLIVKVVKKHHRNKEESEKQNHS